MVIALEEESLKSLIFCFTFLLNFHQFLIAAPKYASIVVDGETGRVLHGTNESEERYPASLAKKMTLYLIFESLAAGRISLSTRFRVSERAAMQCPSKIGLEAGETITVENIIKALIVRSANDAAVAAAEGLSGSVERFAELMSRRANSLGMTSTIFKNSAGVNDFCTTDRAQYTTARDQAVLGISLYRDFPQYTHYFKVDKFVYNGNIIRTHNKMLGKINGLDGIKTGFANAPGFNISTSALRYDSENKPHRIFVVVMGGRTWRSRDRHAEELIEQGFKALGCYSSFDEKPEPIDVIEKTDDIILKVINKNYINTEKTSPKTPKEARLQKLTYKKPKKPTKQILPADSISYLVKNTKLNRITKIKYKKFKPAKTQKNTIKKSSKT